MNVGKLRTLLATGWLAAIIALGPAAHSTDRAQADVAFAEAQQPAGERSGGTAAPVTDPRREKSSTAGEAQSRSPGTADTEQVGEPATPVDVGQHLERIEQILESMLAIAPPGGPIAAEDERVADPPQRVGTAGTTVTERTGDTVLVERAKLEDLRVHVQQAREALRQVKDEQP
jgi:hypothetical protein